MTTIVTRAGKGAPLSWVEADANFINLNNNKLETSTAATTYTTKVDPATSGTLTHSGDTVLSGTLTNSGNTVLSGTLTHSGDIVLSGTGKRITGDFSNATPADRLVFQTSTPNSQTAVAAIPSGTNTSSQFIAYNNSNLNELYQSARLVALPTEVSLRSGISPGATFLPMTFHTGGSERLRIGANGEVVIQQAQPAQSVALTVENADVTLGSSASVYVNQGGSLGRIITTDGATYIQTASENPLYFGAYGKSHTRLDIDGSFKVITPAGLGYGPGAGGTVTQAASKSTAVTLNKPCGQITTHNGTLASGSLIFFTVNNSLVGPNDTVIATTSVAASASYLVTARTVKTGSFQIGLKNISDTGTASEAVAINFAIIKGATA